jgi:hypothetical protein
VRWTIFQGRGKRNVPGFGSSQAELACPSCKGMLGEGKALGSEEGKVLGSELCDVFVRK